MAAFVLLLAGAGTARASLGVAATSVAITGGDVRERAIVRQLVAAIRPRTIAGVRIGRPCYFGERREPRERALLVSVRSGRSAVLARAWWEAGLLAAAARGRDRRGGLPAVGMVELLVSAPDGRMHPEGGIAVISTPGLAGRTPEFDAPAVAARIRAALGSQSGAHVVELAMLHTDGSPR
jgi:hypothetical protein